MHNDNVLEVSENTLMPKPLKKTHILYGFSKKLRFLFFLTVTEIELKISIEFTISGDAIVFVTIPAEYPHRKCPHTIKL